MVEPILDCLVIGAGPAGLTAATYLARFRRTVLVIEDGQSRAALIPVTRNYPGFPEGISGQDLLGRIRGQAERCRSPLRTRQRATATQRVDRIHCRMGGAEALPRAR